MTVEVAIVAADAAPMTNSQRPAAVEHFAGKPLVARLLAAIASVEPRKVWVLGEVKRLQEAVGPAAVSWFEPQPHASAGAHLRHLLAALPSAGMLLWASGNLPLLAPKSIRDLVAAARYCGFSCLGNYKSTQVFALDLSLAHKCSNDGVADVLVAAERQVEIAVVQPSSPDELIQVRDKPTLVGLEREYMTRRGEELLEAGLLLRDPKRFDLCGELTFSNDVEIDPDVAIYGTVHLAERVKIGSHCILRDAAIGAGTEVRPYSIVESTTIGAHCGIGPFARLRPGTRIGDRVQIGNYVEAKEAEIASECRINHLSFIGNATLGWGVTVGAGTITCNHDGYGVQRTVVGDRAYVGSGCLLVAPVRVGAGATIGSGSTITEDAPADQLTLARTRQFVVQGWKGPKSRRDCST